MSKRQRETRQAKCERIVLSIIARCNDARAAYDSPYPVIGFEPDGFGENTLTITSGGSHTHVGVPECTVDELIDQLHSLLIEGRGLSWA